MSITPSRALSVASSITSIIASSTIAQRIASTNIGIIVIIGVSPLVAAAVVIQGTEIVDTFFEEAVLVGIHVRVRDCIGVGIGVGICVGIRVSIWRNSSILVVTCIPCNSSTNSTTDIVIGELVGCSVDDVVCCWIGCGCVGIGIGVNVGVCICVIS